MARTPNRGRLALVASSKQPRSKARATLASGGAPKICAVFPGSFDPFTKGHSDLARRAVGLFDRVVVGVLSNSNKQTLFSIAERTALVKQELSDLGNQIEVVAFSGLLVDFARSVNARVIIRGLRAVSDYDYETQMALMNKRLAEELETLFLVAREENSYISSSIVKQVASFGGDVNLFVAPHVAQALASKYSGPKIG